MHAVECVNECAHCSKGKSRFFKCLIQAIEKSPLIMVNLGSKHYSLWKSELAFERMIQDIHTFCLHTERKLIRAQAIHPIPGVSTQFGLLLYFSASLPLAS